MGESFKLLGVLFDTQLAMTAAIDALAKEMFGKLHGILRARRYHSDDELVRLYKAHVLSYTEYRTAAIYHAEVKALKKIDEVQSRLL